MYIVTNRFRVAKGSEQKFETIWTSRKTHLDEVPGFKEFHLLRGPEAEDHTLYASHAIWESRDDFEAWTKSEAFRKAHAGAARKDRSGSSIYLGSPRFEGFEAILEQTKV